jgi:uncharacterized protein (TIGR02421 family)
MVEYFKENRLGQLEAELEKDYDINVQLPGSGQIYIERKLPFLLVYRPSDDNRDMAIENMIKNEASYFICPDHLFAEVKVLLKKVVKKLSDEFGALLLIEIWTDPKADVESNFTAGFVLYGPFESLPEPVASLQDHVEKMNLAGLKPVIHLNATEERGPEHLQPLMERKKLKQLECLLLGLKVEPFYKNIETGQVYPLLERRLYSEFSEVFRKSVYDFVKVQSNKKISSFQSLAKRTIKPETWEIDKQLLDIDDQIHFLLLVSPVNTASAWKEFSEGHCRKAPVFHYRMLPNDPELMKRSLYNIKIEDIDDPTLGYLFRDKRAEVDKMLTMLNERETPGFLYGSLQLFGEVNKGLLAEAHEILDTFPVQETEKKWKEESYSAWEFAELARQELIYLQSQWPGVSTKVEIKDTITDLIVDKGVLNIPVKTRIPKSRAAALIQHEVGTHLLTYYNGKCQPLQLLSGGIPSYEQLQEGIAVLAEYLTGNLDIARIQMLAARVIAVDSLLNDHDFIKTFQLLTETYHFKPKKAFLITTRVYRGGGFTKDAVYLGGLCQLIEYLKEGNPLEPLLNGKIRQNYLPVVQELISRKILKPVRIRPRYLSNPESLDRLSNIKKIEKITDLINTTP